MDEAIQRIPMRAVVIGVNGPSAANTEWAMLKGAEDDARRFYRDGVLGALGGSDEASDLLCGRERRPNLGLVRGRILDVLSLEDKRGGIRASQSKLEYDLAVIYFAGHADPRGNDLSLIVANTTKNVGNALSMREVMSWVKESPVRYIVIILDCCFAGQVGTTHDPVKVVLNHLLHPNASPRQPGSGRAVLASSWANELSAERNWGGTHEGVFTHYLLTGLAQTGFSGNPPAMNPIFKQVDAASLHTYITRELEHGRFSAFQHPELYVWGTSPVLIKQETASPQRSQGTTMTQMSAKLLWHKDAGDFPSPVSALDLSSDGQWVVLGFADGALQCASAAEGTTHLIGESLQRRYPTHVVASPDAKTCALVWESAGGYSLSLKELSGNYEERSLCTLPAPVERVQFHPASELIALCTSAGDLQIRTTQGDCHWSLDTASTGQRHINDFAFCYPSGKQLAVAVSGQTGIYVWDIYERRPQPQGLDACMRLLSADWAEGEEEPLHVVAIPREEQQMAWIACATRRGRLFVWNLAEDIQRARATAVDDIPLSLTLSPSANMLGCGTLRGRVLLVPPSEVAVTKAFEMALPGGVSALAFSPREDSPLMAVGTRNGAAGLWAYQTGREIMKVSKSDFIIVRFSRNGARLLIAGLKPDAKRANGQSVSFIEMWEILGPSEVA